MVSSVQRERLLTGFRVLRVASETRITLGRCRFRDKDHTLAVSLPRQGSHSGGVAAETKLVPRVRHFVLVVVARGSVWVAGD